MKFKKIFQKRYLVPLIILIAAVVYFSTRGGDKQPQIDFETAQRGNITREVNVTGNVKAAQSVDLAFETSGKINQVLVKVGDKVVPGARLLTLQSGVLSAQLSQAQANLEAEQAVLSGIKRGTRIEEMQSAQTTVANAQRSLADSQANLANVKEKAAADLKSVYDSTLAILQKSVSVGKTSLTALTDIQYGHFLGTNGDDAIIANKKEAAVFFLLGASGAGKWASEHIAPLNGGAFGDVQKAVASPNDYQLIDAAIRNTKLGLQAVKDAFNAVPITDDLSSTEKTSLSTEKTNIATEIYNVSVKEQAIAVQKVTNQNAIAAAQESVNAANNSLLTTKDTLALKQAGSTPEQIATQEARVKSALANAQNYQAQIGKTVLVSPINGVVTKQEAKLGEIISANSVLVSIISEAQFEIKANVAEIDISGLAIGNKAKVTLDAYGSDESFEATVVAIDPAETVIDSISTYKVTLQFTKEDSRVKSGMTANVDILTDTRENVVVIPYRAIVRRNGNKIVRVLEGENMREAMVETGLRSSDARVEIISGVKEGDKVVTYIEE